MKKVLFVGLILALVLLAVPAAATITFESTSWAAYSVGDTTHLSISAPSGTAAGDLLLAQIDADVLGSASGLTITPPSGWTQVVGTTRNGGLYGIGQTIYYKVATPGESGPYVWGFSASATSEGAIFRYSGADPVNPIIASSSNVGTTPTFGGSTSMTANGVTAEANSMLVGCYGIAGDRAITAPSGMTERYQHSANGVPNLRIQGVDQAVGVGATGTRIAIPASNVGAVPWIAQLVALRAAPIHTVLFATAGLAASTSVDVTYSGTSPANLAVSGTSTFSSPGPSIAILTRPGTEFTFAFPTIAHYALDSVSQTSPITTGADGGTTTITATYLALTPPEVTEQPLNQTVTYGNDATFSAAASGHPAPTLQWQERANSESPWTDIDGATTSPLTVAGPTASTSGREYRAVFSNSEATTPSDPATLTVDPRPITVTADSGQTKVQDTPDPVLTYQVTSGSLIPGDSFTGDLSRAPGEDVGDYAILPGSLTAGDNYALTLAPDGIFSITPAPPEAEFTANTTSGTAPLTVRFTDDSTGIINSHGWDFGDGGTSTETNATHTYTAAGNYTVNLTVANAAGSDSEVKTGYITVSRALAIVPGGVGMPTDTDADGLYDDVNGNGRKDFGDVVLYFNQMTWIAESEPISAFDYNKNGQIDFADIVWLFNNL